jgi:hypothetical protein
LGQFKNFERQSELCQADIKFVSHLLSEEEEEEEENLVSTFKGVLEETQNYF